MIIFSFWLGYWNIRLFFFFLKISDLHAQKFRYGWKIFFSRYDFFSITCQCKHFYCVLLLLSRVGTSCFLIRIHENYFYFSCITITFELWKILCISVWNLLKRRKGPLQILKKKKKLIASEGFDLPYQYHLLKCPYKANNL